MYLHINIRIHTSCIRCLSVQDHKWIKCKRKFSYDELFFYYYLIIFFKRHFELTLWLMAESQRCEEQQSSSHWLKLLEELGD